ncbi:MAG TPA: FHA domain-containing protein, partial [Marmoricola sp.]|nr:FHA domain-containing protein [Marmoricola sp.]
MFKITDPNLAVFVELSSSESIRVATFAPYGEWAFVVGSAPRADLHIDKAGVAPVQFHIERSEGGVWLIPGYGIADLRVNANCVVGPMPLDERNVIEFCGVRLEAVVHDGEGFAADSDSFTTNEIDVSRFRSSYSLELPEDNELTLPAMPVTPGPSVVTGTVNAAIPRTAPPDCGHVTEAHEMAEETRRMPRRQLSAVVETNSQGTEQTAQRIVPFQPQSDRGSPAFTLNGTQIMAPYRGVPGVQREARVNAPRFEPPRIAPTPPQLQRQTLLASTEPLSLAPSRISAVRDPYARAQPAPTVRRNAPTARHVAWLTRLGLVTKAQ